MKKTFATLDRHSISPRQSISLSDGHRYVLGNVRRRGAKRVRGQKKFSFGVLFDILVGFLIQLQVKHRNLGKSQEILLSCPESISFVPSAPNLLIKIYLRLSIATGKTNNVIDSDHVISNVPTLIQLFVHNIVHNAPTIAV